MVLIPGLSETEIQLIDKARSSAKRRIFEQLRGGISRERLNEILTSEELTGGRQFLTRLNELEWVEEAGGEYQLTPAGQRAGKLVLEDCNPARAGSKRAETFEILSDCEWHCSSCELPSSQPAKDIQMLRKAGFEFVQETGQGQGDYRHCGACDARTFHRKLKYPFPTQQSITRQAMPDSFKQRVRELYDHRDAFDGSSPSMTLEVDHREPEIRWTSSENYAYEKLSEAEIRENFQVLSRNNNLLKSRKCEECVKTGRRPPFMGVKFWYRGGAEYNSEDGCVGCGWYNPHRWRRELNQLVCAES